MAENNKPEMLEWDDDDDEFVEVLDNSMADFTGGWFALEVTDSECTQWVNEWGKSVNARVALKIIDHDTFDGYASAFLRMKDKRIPEQRKRKAFFNALTDEETGKQVEVTYKKVTDTEGNKKVILDGIQGERLGAYLELDEKTGNYLQVKDAMFCSYSELPSKLENEEPF
jgi:hypothetical protein